MVFSQILTGLYADSCGNSKDYRRGARSVHKLPTKQLFYRRHGETIQCAFLVLEHGQILNDNSFEL